MEWRATIGLEVHAELNTKTKMFCDSRNDPREERPNANICPVCMAHPGTLPVINKEAVRHVLRVGAAVGGTVADYTEFDRKNYFYPDIPKGYQISQYKYPLISGGSLSGIALTRVHLEEDTARSSHIGGLPGQTGKTLIDFNRAGVPLMELVTEPVIHDAQTAGRFARELQLLLRTLGASEANMEEGQMRVEANISVSRDEAFGTKVEVKNLNSFRSVERAIEHEIARQIGVLEKGGTVAQETRGFDETKGTTFSQRKKESSHDYRYFPDPDLPKLALSVYDEFSKEAIAGSLPELPWQKRERFVSLGLKQDDAEMFVRDESFGRFFDTLASKEGVSLLTAANYLASDVAGLIASDSSKHEWLMREDSASRFAELMGLIAGNKVSSRGAKNILALLFSDTARPTEIAEREGLFQQSDTGALEKAAQEVIEANPGPAAEYKAGKEAALQFLVGQGMRTTKGSANPQVLREVFIKLLS
jgi:aspartyl-tRNA(Asn)/glutamyl-tRNA(Gln) amidotransferase subunit B